MSDIFDLFKKIEKPSASALPVTHIIVGLGNVGAEYVKTRHNVGFMAIDYIADKIGVRIDKLKFNAYIGEGSIGGKRVLLMKPTTYMNRSGIAIAEAASFYKIAPENVVVLCDEISFEPGLFRIRRKGSAGGHNGLKSVIASLGSENFPRIKIGVGQKPTPEYDLVNWVLGKFPDAAVKAISERYEDIYASAELIISDRCEEAMNKFSK